MIPCRFISNFFGRRRGLLVLPLLISGQGAMAAEDLILKSVESPPVSARNPFYVANREPLAPSPFIKLPIGSITPGGWLLHQLELEARGMTGRLPEISKWCKFDGNAWSDPNGQGQNAWEELPYWLKGYGDLGYVLKDESILRTSRQWIDAVLASQEPDGFFGPRTNKISLDGHPDLWPHMVMLNVLQSFYEYTNDTRVLPFLGRYLKWLDAQPPEAFGRGYWPKLRFGDTIETAYWLYNRTGEAWLLGLAKKIHDNMGRWDTGVINWHNVNIAQGFREPGVYSQQDRDPKSLRGAEANYQTVMDRYGQFPGGGFAGDENCRTGFVDPRQGFETCGMVEFMHSFEMLTKISANPVWADRCEEMAFNSLPAALTADAKALHYLTCPNQVQLDKENKAPALDNSGTMFSYSPFAVYRCCQHNVSHGWPYYAEELWLATPDRGLCASLYAASDVSAKVGDDANVTIAEATDYPFSDQVKFTFWMEHPGRFPLYLRIPRWCDEASVTINGKKGRTTAKPLSYLAIERTWKQGDVVVLHLPMQTQVRRWARNQNAASIDYGPLSFSLRIGERWARYGGSEAWPETEVFPTTPWNYGLVLEGKNPSQNLKVIKKSGSLAYQPFTPEAAPIEIRAQVKKIPAWKQDSQGLIGKLQPSPVKSDQPTETVTLIPMGAARLRVTTFPVIGSGPAAQEWASPRTPPVSASHCFASDTVEALIDGLEPKTSNDHSIPRFTWWDHRGTVEWVQRDFPGPKSVAGVEVYWFDDTGAGSCRVPESWRVLYRDGDTWKEVAGASGYTTKLDGYNRVEFGAVQTTALRIEAKLKPGFSGGILEWKLTQR